MDTQAKQIQRIFTNGMIGVAVRTFVFPVCFGLSMLGAQDTESPETKAIPEESSGESAWLRCWADLGGNAYTLRYEGETPRERGHLFINARGFEKTGGARGYTTLSSGKYRFTLVSTNDGNLNRSLETELDAGNAYTLFIAMTADKPEFRLISEYPTPPQERGIYIYNLLKEPVLWLDKGQGAPVKVPYSVEKPFVLPASEIKSDQVILTRLSKRNTEIRSRIPYDESKISALFVRNHYNQATVIVLPSEPQEE